MSDKIRAHTLMFTLKRMMRHCDKFIDAQRANIKGIDKEIHQLQESRFNHLKVGQLTDRKSAIEQAVLQMRGERKEVGLALSNLMKAYDGISPDAQDIAQLLGISHVAYQKFVEQNPVTEGSLHSAAFMGAETWFEKEVSSGGRAARDNPLYWATWYEFSHLLHTNKEFSAAIGQAFDDTFGPLPRYQRVENMDGSVSMARMPPRLRVVEGGT